MASIQPEGIGPFDELYASQRESVYRTVRAIVLDHGAAQDLTQEVFERAYRAQDRYRSLSSPQAWLHRIAVNLAISYWRRQKLGRLLPVRLFQREDPAHDFDRAEARTLVEQALAAISPKLRAVVVLYFYQQLTREEIASALQIPPGTVASRLRAALEIMNRTLAVDQTGGLKRQVRRVTVKTEGRVSGL